mmetsp:Transcript_9995/g.12677  ORF Transcript_9995/g.12677 Transcript_9995/m.12677 type:complete len:1018 (+) Transcript_9995:194-3247(+)
MHYFTGSIFQESSNNNDNNDCSSNQKRSSYNRSRFPQSRHEHEACTYYNDQKVMASPLSLSSSSNTTYYTCNNNNYNSSNSPSPINTKLIWNNHKHHNHQRRRSRSFTNGSLPSIGAATTSSSTIASSTSTIMTSDDMMKKAPSYCRRMMSRHESNSTAVTSDITEYSSSVVSSAAMTPHYPGAQSYHPHQVMMPYSSNHSREISSGSGSVSHFRDCSHGNMSFNSSEEQQQHKMFNQATHPYYTRHDHRNIINGSDFEQEDDEISISEQSALSPTTIKYLHGTTTNTCNSIWDVFKTILTTSTKQKDLIQGTSLSTPTSSSSAASITQTCNLTNICTQIQDSPATPEYEKLCKSKFKHITPAQTFSLSSSATNATAASAGTNHRNHHGNLVKTVKRNNGTNGTSGNLVETVKRSNGTNGNLVKAVKRNNGNKQQQPKQDQSFIFMDETRKYNNKERGIQSYQTYNTSSAETFIKKSKECFYSGFDGKRNHFTYVSPKKDTGLPEELQNIVLTKPIISTSLPSSSPTTRGYSYDKNKKGVDEDYDEDYDTLSPLASDHHENFFNEAATTVVHVVQSRNRGHKSDDNDFLRMAPSFDTTSFSMVSEERRIVNGYLNNADDFNHWKDSTSEAGINYDTPRNGTAEKLATISSSRPPLINCRKVKSPTPPWSPNEDQTVTTMGTNGTLHRRTDSASIFTSNSIAQIFDKGTKEKEPRKRRQLSISSLIEIVPETIRKIDYDPNYNDDKDISPLAIDDDDPVFFEDNIPGRKDSNTLHDWSDDWEKEEVVENIMVPPEPNGTYLPKSSAFKEDGNGRHQNSCLEGWLAFSKGSRLIDDLNIEDGDISRKDLRYAVIEHNSLYVYNSKKQKKQEQDVETTNEIENMVKVLKLSKEMRVEMKYISKRHGHCVLITDPKKDKTVCTLLPVRLCDNFFRDEQFSQVVRCKKFKKIQHCLFGQNPNTTRPVFQEISNNDPHFAKEKENKSNSNTWPSTMPEIAPEEQNTTALCLQFALDGAIRLKY